MAINRTQMCGRPDVDTVLSPAKGYRYWNTRMDADMKGDDDEDDKPWLEREQKDGRARFNNEPERYEANHRNAVPDAARTPTEMATSSGNLASPNRDEELERIIAHIDQKHCSKYKWYIERHIRTIFIPKAQPSRQLYYRRVMQTHYTKVNHETKQIHASSENKGGYYVKKMRPSAFPRIDYEAALAQYTARQTSQSLAWASSKKRVPSDKLGAVLHEAVRAYGWPKAITDAIVDEVLTRDGIRDLDAFDEHQGNLTAANPATNGLPSREPELDLGNMAANNQDAQEHEPSLRPSIMSQQTSLPGSISGSDWDRLTRDRLTIKPPYQSEPMSQHNAQEKLRVNNRLPEDRKQRRERKMRLRRLQQQRMIRLEEARLKFEQDMQHLFSEYSRQRSEIEKQFVENMASDN
ncbi:hypothetical protein F5Y05DRAFT_211428 [Hypoxylon sp. FL0543]|nr:hypothetical protein F5Y05DRAFT_211428 [Hypoxylon sp. FL0543]